MSQSLADRLFIVRPSGAEDYALIVDSFKRNVAKANGTKKRWKVAEAERALLDRILWMDETECRVLAAKGNEGHIAGWVAWTPVGEEICVIHFAYVKWNYRPLRLAEDLFRLTSARGKRLVYTFASDVAEKLALRLVSAGEVMSADYLAAADFLKDMGETDDRDRAREAQS